MVSVNTLIDPIMMDVVEERTFRSDEQIQSVSEDLHSIEQVSKLNRVDALDLSRLRGRLLRLGWTTEQMNETEKLYKMFLKLCFLYPEKAGHLVPTEAIDEMWHAHILFTRKYAEDCQHIFGTFLHHANSDYGEEEVNRLNQEWSLTRRLFYKEFGVKLQDSARKADCCPFPWC